MAHAPSQRETSPTRRVSGDRSMLQQALPEGQAPWLRTQEGQGGHQALQLLGDTLTWRRESGQREVAARERTEGCILDNLILWIDIIVLFHLGRDQRGRCSRQGRRELMSFGQFARIRSKFGSVSARYAQRRPHAAIKRCVHHLQLLLDSHSLLPTWVRNNPALRLCFIERFLRLCYSLCELRIDNTIAVSASSYLSIRGKRSSDCR